MEHIKPENIERSIRPSQAEVEKAEVNLRTIERAKSLKLEDSRKDVTVKGVETNATYEKNGYSYKTDNLGRTIHVSGSLRLEKGIRNPNIQKEVREQYGLKGDEGGHIIGAQFDGPPDAFNIFPQNSEFNAGKWSESGWANMEREWADALKDGKTVNVAADLRYGNDSMRPKEIYVRYDFSDGKSSEIIFQNQAHDQIRYFSSGKT
jgi:filamentous hemagglutinin